MTNLTIRRPAFAIDETVPFQWQPANPGFGLFGNAFTFLAIAFERYIVKAIQLARPLITDPAVAEEADAFARQEGAHAAAHGAHARALIARYPALAETLASTHAAYDELLEREDIEYHLAYIANLEATFMPLFKMMIENRGPLFAGGDDRVGTLLLWHFVEEIEHRSSALVVHRHVTSNRWYRLRRARAVLAHTTAVYQHVIDDFERHIPLEDRHIPATDVDPRGLWLGEMSARIPLVRRRASRPSMLAHVPGKELAIMAWHLLRSQLPAHDPGLEPLPAWADAWHAAYDSGADVTSYVGARL